MNVPCCCFSSLFCGHLHKCYTYLSCEQYCSNYYTCWPNPSPYNNRDQKDFPGSRGSDNPRKDICILTYQEKKNCKCYSCLLSKRFLGPWFPPVRYPCYLCGGLPGDCSCCCGKKTEIPKSKPQDKSEGKPSVPKGEKESKKPKKQREIPPEVSVETTEVMSSSDDTTATEPVRKEKPKDTDKNKNKDKDDEECSCGVCCPQQSCALCKYRSQICSCKGSKDKEKDNCKCTEGKDKDGNKNTCKCKVPFRPGLTWPYPYGYCWGAIPRTFNGPLPYTSYSGYSTFNRLGCEMPRIGADPLCPLGYRPMALRGGCPPYPCGKPPYSSLYPSCPPSYSSGCSSMPCPPRYYPYPILRSCSFPRPRCDCTKSKDTDSNKSGSQSSQQEKSARKSPRRSEKSPRDTATPDKGATPNKDLDQTRRSRNNLTPSRGDHSPVQVRSTQQPPPSKNNNSDVSRPYTPGGTSGGENTYKTPQMTPSFKERIDEAKRQSTLKSASSGSTSGSSSGSAGSTGSSSGSSSSGSTTGSTESSSS